LRKIVRQAIQTILPAEMGMGVDSEILMEAAPLGLRITEVLVSVKYGEGKTSTYNPIIHTLDVIFSIVKLISIRHPILFYGVPGLVMIGIGEESSLTSCRHSCRFKDDIGTRC
jgi:hypothetical protein